MKPLDGLVVLDLSRVLAGPYATMYLADMGAKVIKVERPGKGDDTRGYGPPFVAGESCYFMSINRGKQSICIDMKKPEGLALVKSLAQKADILVENFRPGSADRLGLGYKALSESNPALIYASVSGFGHQGLEEYSKRPGYDLLAQGLSGFQAITGAPDGPPYRAGVAIGDLVAGIYTVLGILAALVVKQKTGRGQHVDVSLLDGLLSLLSYQAGISLNGDGEGPSRMGNAHPTICPYSTYQAKDGFVNIAAGNDTLFESLAKALGKAELAADPRFATNSERVRNREALDSVLSSLVSELTVDECSSMMEQYAIPGGPIREVKEALAHPQAAARNMIVELAHKVAGPIKVTGFPIHLSETPSGPELPPPALGADTTNVLRDELQLSQTEIEALRAAEVIG